MDFTQIVFKSIQKNSSVLQSEKPKLFRQHIRRVETIFKRMLKARFTLNLHSMTALRDMMQFEKGYRSLKELMPSNHAVTCNRRLLNAASSEIVGPLTPLNINISDELKDK